MNSTSFQQAEKTQIHLPIKIGAHAVDSETFRLIDSNGLQICEGVTRGMADFLIASINGWLRPDKPYATPVVLDVEIKEANE